jgi:hypothetical protein
MEKELLNQDLYAQAKSFLQNHLSDRGMMSKEQQERLYPPK